MARAARRSVQRESIRRQTGAEFRFSLRAKLTADSPGRNPPDFKLVRDFAFDRDQVFGLEIWLEVDKRSTAASAREVEA